MSSIYCQSSFANDALARDRAALARRMSEAALAELARLIPGSRSGAEGGHGF